MLHVFSNTSSSPLAASRAKTQLQADFIGEPGEPISIAMIKVTSDPPRCYESLLLTDVPPKGKFQPLFIPGEEGGPPTTPYGPGDVGYVGGRWAVTTPDGEVVRYFVCPLVGDGVPCP